MAYKIFFAYQSDIESKYCKGFIQAAVENVILNFKKKGVEIHLDFGFRGTPGTPLLIDEMLKKSRDADMVLVDLTFTSSKSWFEAKKLEIFCWDLRFMKVDEDKKSSNPNVLLETGYAWAQKGTYRTLAIMNEAFGHPSELSVDMKGFRWPITYKLDSKNYTEKKTIRKELEKDLFLAIKTSIDSEISYQRDKFRPLKIIGDWQDPRFESKYCIIPELSSAIDNLRIAFNGNNPSIPQRIIGPPGSGRTRLAREALNDIDGHYDRDPLWNSILYYDLSLTKYDSIESQVLQLVELGQKKVIIIDNCEVSIHKRLVQETRGTEIKILTIGDDKGGHENSTVVLSEKTKEEIVKAQLEERSLPKEKVNVALKFIGNDLNKSFFFLHSALPDYDLMDEDYKVRWNQILGDDFDDGLRLLEFISMFKYIGYDGDYKEQFGYVIEQFIGSIDEKKIQILIGRFLELGLIIKKGDFILVDLFDQELSFSWWNKASIEQIHSILINSCLHSISKQLGIRLIELATNDEEVVKSKLINALELINYDFLDTYQGAELLLRIGEIIPVQFANRIAAIFQNKSLEEIGQFRNGRRGLIFLLEKLSFRSASFQDSVTTLFKLSLSENENYANNATGQFSQLFQVALPGTEVDLSSRFEVLKRIYEEYGVSGPVLSAVTRSLTASHFHRAGSPENQLGNVLKDYNPSPKEVYSYWSDIIDLLIAGYNDNQDAFEEVFIEKLNDQLIYGHFEKSIEFLKLIIETRQRIPSRVHQSLINVLRSKNLDEEKSKVIETLIKSHLPVSVEEKLDQMVTNAPYQSKKVDEEWVDISAIKAKELAEELKANNDDSWIQYLEAIQSGEQRQSFAFGAGIATDNKNLDELVDKAIESLKVIPFLDQNEMFIHGIVSEINNEDFTRSVIEKLKAADEVKFHAIRVHRFLTITSEDAMSVAKILSEGEYPANSIRFLNFDNLSPEELASFLSVIIELGMRWVAVGILREYLKKHNQKVTDHVKIIKEILISKEIFYSNDSDDYDMINLQEILIQSLDEKIFEDSEVSKLSNSLVNSYKGKYRRFSSYLERVLERMLDNYWEVVWPILGDQLTNTTNPHWYEINSLLKTYKKYDKDKIIDWIENSGSNTEVYAMMIMNVNNLDTEFNSTIIELLTRYGGNQQMLNELSAILHTYGFSGSATPLLEARIELLEKLVLENDFEDSVVDFLEAEIERFDKLAEEEENRVENFNLGEY